MPEDAAAEPEQLLYSAEVVRDAEGYHLFVRDHRTDALHSTSLRAKVVENLPKYLTLLRREPAN